MEGKLWVNVPQDPARALAGEQSQTSANRGEYRRLDQKDRNDLQVGDAYGFEQTDFPCALGDRDQHHVHDAQAGDPQRDGGDARQRRRQGFQNGGEGVQDRVLR